MADEQFYTILTNVGKAKVANAALLSSNVALKTLKVGDGNGAYYNPTEEQKDLKNVVYTCNVGSVSVDKDNPNWIVAETIIPGNIGGFTIREIGLFDVDGDMIAIGKYPETYKPVVANGASKDLNVRTIFEVSNAASVNLSINPSIIIATKEDINNLQKQITSNDEDIAVLSNSNLLINGDFQVWQRGKSFSNLSYGQYTADRWNIAVPNSDMTNITVNKEGGGIKISNPNGQNTFLRYFIEESDSSFLFGKTLTLSVKLKNDPNIKCITWKFIDNTKDNNKTERFDIIDINIGYAIDKKSLVVQLITINGYHDITYEWAKLEIGDKATPFYSRSYGEELQLCQRYYEKSYEDTLMIGGRASYYEVENTFKVEKRISPTCIIGHLGDGENYLGVFASGNVNVKAQISNSIFVDKKGFKIGLDLEQVGITNLQIGDTFMAYGYYIADAEIY
ncbi:hypothetical protein CNEO4_80131 [Clostridium neonatale]|uniref:phage tail protein n=1 Tax=Clostridium neonatale TaxID=137838 RepID=UPI00291BD59C|nr:phage tail protein [Clostridium neonatale]CAI3700122.1 hypothetical protein CNEO4_80131 [Clostridium neonatale]